ncbi:MAG: hypothetical protein DRP55_02110 [Spirochaetes bacterium]|nr:MAG: hypothetical protein DRP55_02110 [Spirochaetota bacterium]
MASFYKKRNNLIFFSIIFLALIILPNFLGYYQRYIIIEMLIWGLYALGFDIILGYTGLLNFGMSSFFGIGTYGITLSVLRLHANLWLAIAITILACIIFSLVYGFLVTRFCSHYFVVFTIVVSMILFFVAMNLRSITGGDEGLTFPVPPLTLGFVTLNLKNITVKYYFVLLICMLVLYLVWRFFESPYGKAIVAVRENEDRARALGYNTAQLKLVSFTLSGTVAGIAGGLYALHIGFTSAPIFFWLLSGKAVMWTVVGGAGTLIGSFLGAGILVYAEDLISSWNADIYPIIVGLILIIVIMLAPKGIMGALKRLKKASF